MTLKQSPSCAFSSSIPYMSGSVLHTPFLCSGTSLDVGSSLMPLSPQNTRLINHSPLSCHAPPCVLYSASHTLYADYLWTEVPHDVGDWRPLCTPKRDPMCPGSPFLLESASVLFPCYILRPFSKSPISSGGGQESQNTDWPWATWLLTFQLKPLFSSLSHPVVPRTQEATEGSWNISWCASHCFSAKNQRQRHLEYAVPWKAKVSSAWLFYTRRF